jgi:pectin methylesterase-like acyl-CoA thioesterase
LSRLAAVTGSVRVGGIGGLGVVASLLLAACATTPPASTPTRPQLDARTASAYTLERVLSLGGRGRAPLRDSWQPLADPLVRARSAPPLDYRVEPSAADGRRVFATVQAAVNQAHVDAAAGHHGGARIVIGISPGRYVETVYVPAGPNPITLWGLGRTPRDVLIEHSVHAGMDHAAYAALLGPVYEAPGLHADIVALYRACTRPGATRTGCSAVLWVARDGFQLRSVSVANGSPPPAGTRVRQAVAFKSEGADRVQLEQVHLLGHQDTLYLRTRGDDHIARSFVHRSLIEGDVDFIFGAGTAFFLDSEIRHVGARRGHAGGWVAAPNTSLHVPYGLVFERCRFTADAPAQGVALARQWFSGARCSPYGEAAAPCRIVAGATASDAGQLPQSTLEAVGKMVVQHSWLGAHIARASPWAAWQADSSAPNHRPVQFDSHDFWQRLQAAGHDPAAWGYRLRAPPEPFLAEYRNHGPGSAAAPR